MFSYVTRVMPRWLGVRPHVEFMPSPYQLLLRRELIGACLLMLTVEIRDILQVPELRF